MGLAQELCSRHLVKFSNEFDLAVHGWLYVHVLIFQLGVRWPGVVAVFLWVGAAECSWDSSK